MLKIICAVLFTLPLINNSANADWDDSFVRQALKVKKGIYLNPGAFTGGDRSVDDFTIKNIRIGTHPEGFDRVVIDLVGNNQDEKSMLARAPLFHVENTGAGKRIVITIFGKPKLKFSTKEVALAAKKTKYIQGIEFLPMLESDRWIGSLLTDSAVKIEAFEFTQPARIIVDLKK